MKHAESVDGPLGLLALHGVRDAPVTIDLEKDTEAQYAQISEKPARGTKRGVLSSLLLKSFHTEKEGKYA